jgi:hypothetical protein
MLKEFTIKVKMENRWIPHFLGMLKAMQILGGIGSSRWIKFYADGDGDFRPKFETDIKIEPVEVKIGSKQEGWNGEVKTEFDAG